MLIQEAQLAEEDSVLGAIEHNLLTLVLMAKLSIWCLSFREFLFYYILTIDHLN